MTQIDFQDLLSDISGILILLAMLILVILIMTFALKVGINAVKGKKTGLGEVFITGLILIFIIIIITAVVGSVFPSLSLLGSIVALIIGMFIIQSRHDTTFFGALGAIIIYIVVLVILVFLIGLVIGGNILSMWNSLLPNP